MKPLLNHLSFEMAQSSQYFIYKHLNKSIDFNGTIVLSCCMYFFEIFEHAILANL